jgi:hypothetical protein
VFARPEDNVKYALRQVAQKLRGVEIEILTGCGINIELVEDLLLYGMQDNWRELNPPSVGLEELCRLAMAAGVGLTVNLMGGEDLDGWVQEVETQWSPGETEQAVVPVARRCAVCRHPKRLELDLCLSRGVGLGQLSKLFRLSAQTIARHRDLCLAGRLERLSVGLGNAADISSLVGSVAVVDKVLEFATRAGEAALVGQEHAAVDAYVGRMLQGVEIRAKLTGEVMEPGQGEAGSGNGNQGQGPSVSVMVVPSREMLESQRMPMVVDVKGDRV